MTKYVACAIVLLFAVNMLTASSSSQVTSNNAIPSVPGLKSKRTAYLWSVGATLVSIANPAFFVTFPLALIIGPSAGHCYAGNWGQGLVSAGIRIGVAAAGIGASVALQKSYPTINEKQIVVLSVAGGIILGSAIYDYATISRSVEGHNQSVLEGSSMQIMPHIDFKTQRYGISMKHYF